VKNTNKSKITRIYFGIALCGITLSSAVWLEYQRQTDVAWQNHVQRARAQSKEIAGQLSNSLRSIYENIRTISFLPSLRNTDETKNLINEDSLAAIQQIYNNLANGVDVSEVYILQKNFDPTQIDPLTGKLYEPKIMFDQMIINGGKHASAVDMFAPVNSNEAATTPEIPEVEDYEYAQLKQTIDYFQATFPTLKNLRLSTMPMVSSESVITCDNRLFIDTGEDKDRSGLIFSLPIYSLEGEFNGLVSAIVLEKAIQALLPNDNFQLITPNAAFKTSAAGIGGTSEITSASVLSAPSSEQVLFEYLDVKSQDPRGSWKMRTQYKATDFYSSAQYWAIKQFEIISFAIIALMASLGIGITHFWHRRARELHYHATHDGLTGLPNSTLIRHELENALKRTEVGEKFAVLYLDLDRFKLVNDTLGHHAGDLLLKAVSHRLSQCIGNNDVLARIGGDEFVILCNLDGAQDIMNMAAAIIKALGEPFILNDQQATIGTSIGIALAPADGSDTETLIRNADMALFRAKSEERNTYRFFEPEMDEQVQYRRKLEMDLRTAIVEEQFEVYYQAIVDATSEKIVGFEALVRWNHPKDGLIMPSEFIPIAEDIGVIIPLGEWILRKACVDAMTWPKDVRVAVNLSAIQFRNKTLPLIVMSALDKSGLSAKRLELEITESVLISDDETARRALEQLQALGVRIALDDFGTGYSSLSYLRSFKFDKIKIDRTFMKEISSGKGNDLEIVKAVATLGRSLGMSTTAEGIETFSQLEMVRGQGCNEVQGYYYSKPLPIGQTNALFDNNGLASKATSLVA
jgi:diguanylate cyclase (GGDEF)-like protein